MEEKLMPEIKLACMGSPGIVKSAAIGDEGGSAGQAFPK
jgi:hypothetical protein